MKKSKYIGKTFGNWLVEHCYLTANYCGGTKHNAYRYSLARMTSDLKFDKVMVISGNTMWKIATGQVDVESVAKNKKITDKDSILYRFN